MAEAAVDMSSMSSSRYFCHQCNQESNSVGPDFTCPQCLSGFVEEVSAQDNEDPNPLFNETIEENNDSDQQMADILDDLYGQYSGARTRSATNASNGTTVPPTGDRPETGSSNSSLRRQRHSTSEVNPNSQRRQTTRYFQVNFPRNPDSGGFENTQSLEGLFQHILTNVASGQLNGREGGVNVGARGLINIDFPLPLFQVLHGNPGDYAWGEGGLNEIISQLLNQLDGSGPPPMAKEDIDKVPFVAISEEQVRKNLQCTVCMEDFKVAEKVRLLECSHCYHNECIVPWLQMHATCPVCRKQLSTTRTSSRETLSTNSNSDPAFSRPGMPSMAPRTAVPDTSDSNTTTQSSNGTTYESTDDYD